MSHETMVCMMGFLIGYSGWFIPYRLTSPLARLICGSWSKEAYIFQFVTWAMVFWFLMLVIVFLLAFGVSLFPGSAEQHLLMHRLAFSWSVLGVLSCALLGTVESRIRQHAHSKTIRGHRS
jgi:hypothetical protein